MDDLQEIMNRLMLTASACELDGNHGSAKAFARLAREVDKAYRLQRPPQDKREEHAVERC